MTQVQISVAPREADAGRRTVGLALANISRLGEDSNVFGRLVISDVVVPMTHVGEPARLDLERGRYVVSVAMPSGEQINELLEVSGHEPIELVLVPRPQTVERRQSSPAVVPVQRPERTGRQARSIPQSPVRARTTDAVFEFSKQPVPGESQKPQPLFSVGRRKRLATRVEVQRVRPQAPPDSLPRLVDIGPLSMPLQSPFVENYHFVDLQDWLRQLEAAAYNGEHLAPEILDSGLGRLSFPRHRNAEVKPVFDGALRLNNPPKKVNQRYGLSLNDRGNLHQLAILPGAWTTDDGRSADEVVDVYQEWDGIAGAWNLRTTVNDARVSSVLEFMASGDLPRARHLVSNSLQLLMEKVQNPYAAAAAGYVLIYSRDADLENERWPVWLRNLATWFPSLPDAQILLATLCLQRRRLVRRALLPLGEGDNERLVFAHVLLERALRAGIPMFSLGMRLLVENLEILREEFRGSDSRARYNTRYGDMPLDDALQHVRALSRCMKTVQPMTVLDLSSFKHIAPRRG